MQNAADGVVANAAAVSMQNAAGGVVANARAQQHDAYHYSNQDGPHATTQEEEEENNKEDRPAKVVDLTTCGPKRKGRSFVWTEGLFVIDSEMQPVCTVCRQRVAAGGGTTSSNTTNLINHYGSARVGPDHARLLEEARRSHEKKLRAANGPAYSPPPRQQKLERGVPIVKLSALSGRVFESLLDWVIMAQQPLEAPQHPLLRKAFQTATGKPSFEYGGPRKFRTALMKRKATATKELKEMLKGTRPAVTAEIRSSASDVTFIVLTVHYIKTSPSEWVVKEGVCACEPFDGSHTSARIGAQVMSMLTSLGIEKSVISVTADTASKMRNAIVEHTPASIAWIACVAHKIERVLQKYISDPALKKTLTAFIRTSAHLHTSVLSQQNFEAAQRVRFEDVDPKKIPLGCLTRWRSWWPMLSECLEHRDSLILTMKTANDRAGGPGIVIWGEDWSNAEDMVKMIAPFHDAVEAFEGKCGSLPLVPCVTSVLNSHIKTEGVALAGGGGGNSLGATVGEATLDDEADRLNGVPNAIMIASAISARTKGLEWLSAAERTVWRDLVLRTCKELFRADIAREREAIGGAPGVQDARKDSGEDNKDEDEVDEEPPAKRKRSWVARCIQARKAKSGGGDGSEAREKKQGAEASARPGGCTSAGATGGADDGSGSNADYSNLSLQRRMEGVKAEFLQFLDAAELEDEYTGEAELAWWSQNQFAFPTLARLAPVYLAIPASLPAPEGAAPAAWGVENPSRLEGDAADALVFLEGSHGLAWSTALSKAEIAGKAEIAKGKAEIAKGKAE